MVRKDMDQRLAFAIELEKNFRTVFRQMQKELNQLFGHLFTGSEYSILSSLNQKSPQTVSELAQKLEVSTSHITQIIDQLESKQYVYRQRSHLDKRIVEIYITLEGKKAIKKIQKRKHEYLSNRFQSFTDEEIEHFFRLIQKLLS
jgi:DNA-binding MarR family transcriptional regulator